MTITKKTIISMIALGLAATAPVKAQTLAVSQGDLLLSFYQDNGGGSYGANTYVYNLGSAAAWRENTISLNLIANIGADLTTAFGSDWATDTTLRMGLIGGFNGSFSGSGDPARTIYISKGLTSFEPGSTSTPVLSTQPRGTVSTALGGYLNGLNGQDLNGGTLGAIIPVGQNTDYTDYGPTNFGASVNPNAIFTGNTIGTGAGGYDVLAALDLYRILNSAPSEADLSAGLSPGNAVVGTGQYIGSFTLDSSGNLRIDAVPEPSTYALVGLGLMAFLLFRRRQRTA